MYVHTHYFILTLYSIDTQFDASAFENMVEKGEIARDEQFLLFPQCFQRDQITVSQILSIFLTSYLYLLFVKVPIAPNYKGVCLQNTSESHSYHHKI